MKVTLRAGVIAALVIAAMAPPSDAEPGSVLADTAPLLESPKPEASKFEAGNYGVAEKNGAATFTYPIPVPPGRLGLQPQLALAYSSQAPLRGGVAAGWSLGLPAIRLDTSTGTLSEPRYTVELGGTTGRLVPVGDWPFTGDTYRTEIDTTFVRFQFLGAEGWIAHAPDGTTYRFGSNSDATDGVTRWHITSQADAYGNGTGYFWSRVAHPRTGRTIDFAPQRIEYTGNNDARIGANAKVIFTYAGLDFCDGPDAFVGARIDWHGGAPVVEGARRLTGITTYVTEERGDLQAVREISLGYDSAALSCTSTSSPLRILTRIDATAYDMNGHSAVLPPVTLAYGSSARAMGATTTLPVGPLHLGNGAVLTRTLLDVNGDGLLDAVQARKFLVGGRTECQLQWWAGQFGGGFAEEFTTASLPTIPWRDGATSTDGEETCTLRGQLVHRIAGPQAGIDECPSTIGSYNVYHVEDVDGDGRVDLLTTILSDPWFYDPAEDDDLNARGLNPTSCDVGIARLRDPDGGEPPPPVSGCERERAPQRCGADYVWRIYKNVVDQHGFPSFVPAGTLPSVVPVPIELAGSESAIGFGRGSMASTRHVIIDIDGDRRVDAVRFDAPPDPSEIPVWKVYPGDGDGGFGDEVEWALPRTDEISGQGSFAPTSSVRGPSSCFGSSEYRTTTINGLRDLNGDALPDLFTVGDTGLFDVFMNTGSGFAEEGITLLASSGVDQSFLRISEFDPNRLCRPTRGKRTFEWRMADVDADGLLDFVQLSPIGDPDTGDARVRYNAGDRFVSEGLQDLSRQIPWSRLERRILSEPARWQVETDYIDLDGDGRGDLASYGAEAVTFQHDNTSSPARLLTTVENGRGSAIRFSYAPSTDGSVVTQTQRATLPVVTWVVKDVTVSPGFHQPDMTTSYRYANPAYGTTSGDPADPSRFLGFEEVTTHLPLAEGQSARGRVVRTYAYDNVTADGLGRLIREQTFDASRLVTHKQISWRRESLLGGRVVFTHVDTTLTRTCATADSACPTQTANVRRETERWDPVPFRSLSSSAVALYVRAEEAEGSGLALGPEDRRTNYRYDVRGIGERGPFPDDYRILPTREEREEASTGTSGLVFVRRGLDETQYDDRGLPIQSTEWKDDATPAVTTRTFDATGNITSIRKPQQQPPLGSGAMTTYEYDAHKLFVIRTTNELGHEVFTVTDSKTGKVVRRTGPNSKRVSCFLCEPIAYEAEVWHFDGFGRDTEHFVSVDDAELGYRLVLVDRSLYDDFRFVNQGEATRRIDERRRDFGPNFFLRSELSFDGEGRLLEERDVRFQSGQADAITSFEFDAAGNRVEIRTPDPRFDSGDTVPTLFQFDAIGRPVEIVRSDGTSITVEYSGLDRVISEVTEDGSGSRTTQRRDVFGQLVEVVEHDPTGGDAVTRYAYDGTGNLVGVTDADGVATNLEHDFAGNRTAIRRGTRTWQYVYDLNDNLRQEIDGPASTQTTAWQFDDLDRVTRRTPATNALSAQRQGQLGIGPITYQYDGAKPNGIGRLFKVTLPYGTVEYGSYEPRGLVTRETRTFRLPQPSVSGGTDVTRTYNALALPDTVTWDNGHTWRTRYDERGLVKTVEWLDPSRGTFRRVAQNTISVAGQVRTRATDFGQEATLEYDILGRVFRHTVRGASGDVLSDREYRFTEAGDIRQLHVVLGSRTATYSYAYDARHRLRQATAPELGYSNTLSYSKAGNIASAQVSWTGSNVSRNVSYQYGAVDPQAVDRLINVADGSTYALFQYDGPGNVTRREAAIGTWTFDWDGEDQLREERGPRGAEQYRYDHDYQRSLAISSGPLRVRFWSGESETQYGPNGREDLQYLHISDSSGPLARLEVAGGTSRLELQYSDQVQSLILATSDGGSPTATFLYGAFGEVLTEDGATDHRRQFNGKEQDSKTGLGYYGFRYYDPLTFRWGSADPLYRLRPEAGFDNPQRLNLYAFGLNNPNAYLDLDGLEPLPTPQERTYQAGEGAAVRSAQASAYVSVKVGPVGGQNAATKAFVSLTAYKYGREGAMSKPGVGPVLFTPNLRSAGESFGANALQLGWIAFSHGFQYAESVALHELQHREDLAAGRSDAHSPGRHWEIYDQQVRFLQAQGAPAWLIDEMTKKRDSFPQPSGVKPKERKERRPPQQRDNKKKKTEAPLLDRPTRYVSDSPWCVTSDCTLAGAR